MGKLYELLAVEGAKKSSFANILDETRTTFTKKPAHFTAAEKTLEMIADEDQHESGIAERHDMTTTVHEKLKYMLDDFVAPYLDVMYQKEASNQFANGTLEFGGQTLSLPATFLLGLANRLRQLRDVIHTIPTLQPGVEWVEDPAHSFAPHVVKNKVPQESNKTRKVLVPFELAPATKEHKAQVKELSEDRVVGKYKLVVWSSMYSPKQRSDMLARLDSLIEEVDKARQRANDIDAVNNKVGDAICQYLLGD